MARIVKRLRNGPYAVAVDGQNKAFCGCGLSRQRHDAAEVHPEMCTEQQLESW